MENRIKTAIHEIDLNGEQVIDKEGDTYIIISQDAWKDVFAHDEPYGIPEYIKMPDFKESGGKFYNRSESYGEIDGREVFACYEPENLSLSKDFAQTDTVEFCASAYSLTSEKASNWQEFLDFFGWTLTGVNKGNRFSRGGVRVHKDGTCSVGMMEPEGKITYRP